MTQVSTRKQFFAKLLGLTAAAGVVAKLFAKSAPAAAPVVTAPPVQVRPEPRAVARELNAR